MSHNTSVVLSPHFQQFIERKVAEGRYDSASDVIRAGLKLPEEYEANVDAFKAAIEEGEQSGPAVEMDFDAVRAEMRATRGIK